MARALHRCEGEPPQLPHHAGHLVLVLVDARNPPLPPLLDYGHSELVFHPGDPGHRPCDGHAVVNVARSDPDPQARLHEDGIEPVAGVGELSIVGGHVVAAGLELLEGHVELILNGDFVEEVADSVHVLADDIISHLRRQPSVRQPHEVLAVFSLRDLLVEALGVEVEHAGVGGVELLVSDLPDGLAAVTLVSEDAGGLNEVPIVLSIVSVIVEIFVLVDAHLHVVSRLPALPGVGAGVVDHDSLEVEGHLPRGQRVSFEDFVGEVGDVDPGVALAGEVELVLFEVGELVEELDQGLVVVGRHCPVVVLEAALRAAEANASRRLDVEKIGLHVPGVWIYSELLSPFLEHKRPVFVDHPQQAGTPGSSVQPEHDRVIIGISLRIEEDIVEGGSIEVKHA